SGHEAADGVVAGPGDDLHPTDAVGEGRRAGDIRAYVIGGHDVVAGASVLDLHPRLRIPRDEVAEGRRADEVVSGAAEDEDALALVGHGCGAGDIRADEIV